MPKDAKMTKNYQQLTAELDAILDWFQSDEVDLDVAIAKYEKGMALVETIEGYLQSAANTIIKIKRRFDDLDS